MSQRSLPGPVQGPGPQLISYGPHETDLFDWRRGARLVVFALRSVRRRILLFLLVLFAMVGLPAAALVVLPKTYEVESRILAQPNAVLATRGAAGQADQPSRAAAELIVRTENVRSLVRQSKLVEEWPKR